MRGDGQAMDGVSGTKTVVDVNDGDPGGAGVQHAQEGGDPLKVGAIADRSWNGDQGEANQTPEYAGEGGFHPSHHDERIMGAKGGEMSKRAVQASDSDVVETGGPMSQKFQSDVGFLRYGVVGGSRRTDRDPKGARLPDGPVFFGFQGQGPGGGMILALRENSSELFSLLCIYAGNQNGLLLGKHAKGDGLNLGDGFAGSVNDFGGAKPAQTVEIHLGEGAGKVGKRVAKFRHGNFRRERIAVEAGARRW